MPLSIYIIIIINNLSLIKRNLLCIVCFVFSCLIQGRRSNGSHKFTSDLKWNVNLFLTQENKHKVTYSKL